MSKSPTIYPPPQKEACSGVWCFSLVLFAFCVRRAGTVITKSLLPGKPPVQRGLRPTGAAVGRSKISLSVGGAGTHQKAAHLCGTALFLLIKVKYSFCSSGALSSQSLNENTKYPLLKKHRKCDAKAFPSQPTQKVRETQVCHGNTLNKLGEKAFACCCSEELKLPLQPSF